MYTRKFQADTLDQAIKDIKKELGPDAIILKTVTNKGIKGVLNKKKRIEITAAISKKNYLKKAKVDKVFNKEQKDKFYSAKSNHISHMIDEYSGGYGDMALNQQVKTLKSSKLDDFLKETPPKETLPVQEILDQKSSSSVLEHTKEFKKQIKRIDQLESRYSELAEMVKNMEEDLPSGIYYVQNLLRGLAISPGHISRLIQRLLREETKERLEDLDHVFEFILQDMIREIVVERPLFFTSSRPVVSVFCSEAQSGQSSAMFKLGAVKKETVLIQNTTHREKQFTENILGMKVCREKSISGIMVHVRESLEKNKSIVIDYKQPLNSLDDINGFIKGLRRNCSHVEVLLCLSAIHSEEYNRKMAGTLGRLADGIIVNHLDQCLNFGSLFNMALEFKKLPLKLFGTGRTIPDDLEAATVERILANLFQLK